MFTLEECEDKISEIIMNWPRRVGRLEVISQRGELAGWIESWAYDGRISETTRMILSAIYFEGWDRYVAIEQFGVKVKRGNKKTRKIKPTDNKDVMKLPPKN